MCTGFELAMVGLGAASTVATLTQGSKTPSMPAIQEPTKPPQAAKAPDYNALQKSIASGFNPTALTGSQGIPDDKLLLGKPTVLGA